MNDVEMLFSGEYFIGDLTCIFDRKFTTDDEFVEDENSNEEDFDEIISRRENLYYLETELDENKEGGIFNIDGTTFYWYKAKNGRNTYKDNFYKKYPCESGILICFPVSKLSYDEKEILMNAVGDCCHIKNFENNFGCFHSNGTITFGDITIDTNNGEYDKE